MRRRVSSSASLGRVQGLGGRSGALGQACGPSTGLSGGLRARSRPSPSSCQHWPSPSPPPHTAHTHTHTSGLSSPWAPLHLGWPLWPRATAHVGCAFMSCRVCSVWARVWCGPLLQDVHKGRPLPTAAGFSIEGGRMHSCGAPLRSSIRRASGGGRAAIARLPRQSRAPGAAGGRDGFAGGRKRNAGAWTPRRAHRSSRSRGRMQTPRQHRMG
ncbi:MAG: hypothetical protein J3K34DRAFT_45270 [Monoraphidium minutum]|nr:MAG: hypothetical protein J3K34DRAFT_45270 [Monoraphidium minutum]